LLVSAEVARLFHTTNFIEDDFSKNGNKRTHFGVNEPRSGTLPFPPCGSVGGGGKTGRGGREIFGVTPQRIITKKIIEI